MRNVTQVSFGIARALSKTLFVKASRNFSIAGDLSSSFIFDPPRSLSSFSPARLDEVDDSVECFRLSHVSCVEEKKHSPVAGLHVHLALGESLLFPQPREEFHSEPPSTILFMTSGGTQPIGTNPMSDRTIAQNPCSFRPKAMSESRTAVSMYGNPIFITPSSKSARLRNYPFFGVHLKAMTPSIAPLTFTTFISSSKIFVAFFPRSASLTSSFKKVSFAFAS